MRTGAIDNGIARVAKRYSTRGPVLIVVLMVLFSIGGTTEGMAEETLGFYALVVPLMLSLGYDRMVAAGDDPDRSRDRRARLDGQPVRDRRRLRCCRHLDRRRHRPAGSSCTSCWCRSAIVFVLRYATQGQGATPPARWTGPQPGDDEIAAAGIGDVAGHSTDQAEDRAGHRRRSRSRS